MNPIIQTIKDKVTDKTKQVVIEEVKETAIDTVKKNKVNVGMVCLGIGLAIFGIGLMVRRPVSPVTIVRL